MNQRTNINTEEKLAKLMQDFAELKKLLDKSEARNEALKPASNSWSPRRPFFELHAAGGPHQLDRPSA